MKQLKLGRANHCDIVINDATVSSEHLEIFQDDEGNVFITDLNSSNGTFVNGKRISGSEKLNQNDILKVGNSVLPWRNYLKDGFQPTAILEEDKTLNFKNAGSMEILTSTGQSFQINKKKYIFWIVGSVIIVGITALIIFKNINRAESSGSGSSEKSYEETSKTLEEMEADDPVSFLFSGGTYRENLLGDKYKISGTINNSAAKTSYNSILIKVNFFDDHGEYLNSEDYYIYKTVKPGETINFELSVTHYSNVSSINWEIGGAEPIY